MSKCLRGSMSECLRVHRVKWFGTNIFQVFKQMSVEMKSNWESVLVASKSLCMVA